MNSLSSQNEQSFKENFLRNTLYLSDLFLRCFNISPRSSIKCIIESDRLLRFFSGSRGPPMRKKTLISGIVHLLFKK